jgi:DNA-binding transcriptional MerR regulator
MADHASSGSAVAGYRGPTVSNLVGISYRQLDYWARTGLVTPSVRAADGSGSHELRIIKRLLDAGISLQRIREAIRYLRSSSQGRPLTDVTLISDGQRIYSCRSGEEVIDVLSHGQAVFGIAVGRVWADTEGDVAHLPLEPAPAARQPDAAARPPRADQARQGDPAAAPGASG